MNHIRIIAGSLRGRKIAFSESEKDDALRPTPNRVRETLFNWLSQFIINARCLDAFGGSGALGIESISRGATHVEIIEKNSGIAQQIQKNVTEFKISSNQLKVLNQDTLDYFSSKNTQPFDIIYLDPPFQQDLLIPSLQLIHKNQLIHSDSYLYIESHEPLDKLLTLHQLDKFFELFRSKKAGRVYFGLLHPLDGSTTPAS